VDAQPYHQSLSPSSSACSVRVIHRAGAGIAELLTDGVLGAAMLVRLKLTPGDLVTNHAQPCDGGRRASASESVCSDGTRLSGREASHFF
jgi:hypothetical protein